MNVLSQEDGKYDITNAFTRLVGNNEKISTRSLQAMMCTNDQPHPDLVFIVGQPMTTMAFLPWQISFSEFHCIPTLSRLTYNQFKTSLLQYSNCNQRLGK